MSWLGPSQANAASYACNNLPLLLPPPMRQKITEGHSLQRVEVSRLLLLLHFAAPALGCCWPSFWWLHPPMLPLSPLTPCHVFHCASLRIFAFFPVVFWFWGFPLVHFLFFFLWRVAAHAVQVHSTRLLGISIDAALDPHLVACAGAMPGRPHPSCTSFAHLPICPLVCGWCCVFSHVSFRFLTFARAARRFLHEFLQWPAPMPRPLLGSCHRPYWSFELLHFLCNGLSPADGGSSSSVEVWKCSVEKRS